MYILERAITKPYSSWIHDKLIIMHRRNQFREDQGVLVFEWCKNRKIFAIMADGEFVAWLAIDRTPNWAAWQVAQAFVQYHYRGQGLAKQLYEHAVNREGLILASGRSHTKYSAGLWKKFVREDTFNVYAVNFMNTAQAAQVVYDEGELYSTLPLYNDWPRHKTDIRLVAVRRRNGVRRYSKSTRS